VVAPRRVGQFSPRTATTIQRTVSPGGDRMAAEITGVAANSSPLDGMMTTPDLARFLNGSFAEAHRVTGTLWEKVAGATKYGKTILSHATQLRNAESWLQMSAAMGRGLRRVLRGGPPVVLPGTEAGRNFASAFKAVGGEFAADVAPASRLAAALDESTLRTKLLRGAELGVVHTGTNYGELQEWAAMFAGTGRGPVVAARGGKLASAARTADRALTGLYRASDDLGKFYNWLEETSDLRWKYHLDKPEGHPDRVRWSGGRDEAALEAEAAENIKQMGQTYGRSIPIAHKLARNPLVGPFVTFQFEMPRNLWNGIRDGAADIKAWRDTGNPRALAMGTARLGGVVTGATAMAALDAAIGGLGATKAGQMLGLDKAAHTSDDKEAVRRLTAAPWSRYGSPVILSLDGDKVTYMDGSGVDPYAIVTELTNALTDPKSAPEKLYAVADVMSQRYLSPELLAKAGVEFATKTQIEGPLWDAEARQQTGSRAYNLWRTLGPGSALSGENLLRATGVLNPEKGHGRRYELTPELTANLGPRVTTVSYQGAFRGRTAAWNEMRAKVSADYSRSAGRARTDNPNDLLDAKKQAGEDWDKGWSQMQDWVNATRQLLSKSRTGPQADDLIFEWLRDSDVSDVLARHLISGQAMSYDDYRRRTARRGGG
jgi:hypothetical protein